MKARFIAAALFVALIAATPKPVATPPNTETPGEEVGRFVDGQILAVRAQMQRFQLSVYAAACVKHKGVVRVEFGAREKNGDVVPFPAQVTCGDGTKAIATGIYFN